MFMYSQYISHLPNNYNQQQQKLQPTFQPTTQLLINSYDQQVNSLFHKYDNDYIRHSMNNNYYNYFNNNNNNNNNNTKYYNYEIIDQNNSDSNNNNNNNNINNKENFNCYLNDNTISQWYSCTNLTTPTKRNLINTNNNGRISNGIYDSCESLNTQSSSNDNNTAIFINRNNSMINPSANINKRYSTLMPGTTTTTTQMTTLSGHHRHPTSMRYRNRPKTITITDLQNDNDRIMRNRANWRTINNQFNHQRQTPVMPVVNNSSSQGTSPKSVLVSSSSSSSTTATTTTTTTTSSESSAENDRNEIINKNSTNSPNFNAQDGSETIDKPPVKTRRSLLSDSNLNQQHKLSNLTKPFINGNLIRKCSLPPDKTPRQLSTFENNNDTANKKVYSNLYPDDLDQQQQQQQKQPKQIPQQPYRPPPPPQINTTNISRQASTPAFKIIKNVTDTQHVVPTPSIVKKNPSPVISTPKESTSPTGSKFARADFTPHLLRNKQQKFTILRPKQPSPMKEPVTQQNPKAKVYSSNRVINEITKNDSFESIKPVSAITVLATSSKDNLTHDRVSNEISSKHEDEEGTITATPTVNRGASNVGNISTLKKLFKTNNPFDSLINKFNNANNNHNHNKIRSTILNAENMQKIETSKNQSSQIQSAKLSQENTTAHMVHSNNQDEQNSESHNSSELRFSNEQLERKRKYKTIASEKKKAQNERKCIALCDYKSLYSKNINLKKGEEYIIVNSENENWYLVKDKQNNQGWAPSNYLEDIDSEKFQESLDDKSWYHGDITRMQAYLRLTENNVENGTFLVRNNSTEKGKYTLCLYNNGKVYNYKINVDNDLLYISSKNKFSSLVQLIEFYQKNSSGLVCTLNHSLQHKNDMMPPETAGFGYKKFHIERKDLTFIEKIGSGQFGVVLKAEYKSTKIVAIKKMKSGSIDDEINFNREAEFMMKLQNLQELQHKNLVQFYGVSKDTDNSILIVTEYVKHGSLSNYLSKNKERIIKSKSRGLRLLNICLDVCDGMAYLESKHVVHRDLATRNCLVGDGEIVKVADFGLARFTEDYYIANPQSQFPVKWSAPEVIKYRSYSNKSDVWSFGCLMYEVFSLGKMPYGSNTSNSLAAKQIIAGIVPEKPQYCPFNLYDNILLKAWNKDSNNRPSFKQLLQILNDFIN